MGDKTGIEWSDATWNPTVGCSIVSPGCASCYAMKMAARLEKMGAAKYAGLTQASKAGPAWNGTVRLDETALDQPLRWRRPRRIFVNSMSDLFHESLPDEAIDRVFAVMAMAPQHTFQVLTKRPARMRAYFAARRGGDPWAEAADAIADLIGLNEHPVVLDPSAIPLPNVWLGTSVERQQEADERRDHLRALAAAGWLTFVSYEPALGPVDWRGWTFLSWLISGGESGPRARPSHPDWHRAARDFCSFGIAYHFKQWGEWSPNIAEHIPVPIDRLAWVRHDGKVATVGEVERIERREGDQNWRQIARVGKKRAGALLDGREHREFPR